MLKEGDAAPDFTVSDQNGEEVKVEEHADEVLQAFGE
jgi:peroxiredoxin